MREVRIPTCIQIIVLYRNNHFIEIGVDIPSEREDGDIPMEGEDGEDEWRREQQNDISSAQWRPELEGRRLERFVKTWVGEEETEGRRGDA